jgi:hypothetical protein
MFGFFMGTACLVGLFYVLRGGRGGCHGGGRWGGGGRHWGRRGGPGGVLRFLFEALDTSPGQEKEIRSAADEFFDQARSMRRDVREWRADVAKAVSGEFFDETTMGELFARQDDGLDKLRRSVVGGLARVHAVLDENQRKRLAELVERGPYRAWA